MTDRDLTDEERALVRDFFNDPDVQAVIVKVAVELRARRSLLELRLTADTAIKLSTLLHLALSQPPPRRLPPDVRYVGAWVLEHVRAYFADAPNISQYLDVLATAYGGQDSAEDP